MKTGRFTRNDLQVNIYPAAIEANVAQLKSCCGAGVKFCAVVKANGYGHGIENVVNSLKDGDVDFGSVMAGQSVGLMNKVRPLKEALNFLIKEASLELNSIRKKCRDLI